MENEYREEGFSIVAPKKSKKKSKRSLTSSESSTLKTKESKESLTDEESDTLRKQLMDRMAQQAKERMKDGSM